MLSPAISAAELIDEIVAGVDGKIITQVQLEENIRIFQAFDIREDESMSLAELEKLVLYKMIDDYSLKKQAEKQGMQVSDREILTVLDGIRTSTGDRDFKNVLSEKNISLAALNEKIKRELLREKLISWKARELQEKIVVEDAQVDNFFSGLRYFIETGEEKYDGVNQFFSMHRRQIAEEERVLLARIIVDNGIQAEEIFDKLKRNESFVDLAIQHSIGPYAERGGEIGWFALAEIQSPLRTEIAKLSESEFTEPIKINENFYQIIKINKRDELFFENWKDTIRAYLFQREIIQLLDSWLLALRGESFIQIMDEDLRKQWSD